jgi:hypothetical protein
VRKEDASDIGLLNSLQILKVSNHFQVPFYSGVLAPL